MRFFYIVVLAGALAGCAAKTAPEPEPGVQERIARVETGLLMAYGPAGQPPQRMALIDRMRDYHVPAVSIAVIHQGRVEWARAWGQAQEGLPATPHTLFQAASVSKPITALAALRMTQEGKLDLDEPVIARLRSWKLTSTSTGDAEGFARRVTLRRLLSHCAGINTPGFFGYAAGKPVPDLRQVLEGEPPANTDPVRVTMRPGAAMHYSGGGYTIVQQLMIDVSGKPFSELLQSTVLDPLGISEGGFLQPLPSALSPRAAAGHLHDGSVLPGRWHTHPELAAAGLWSTPSDLARVLIDLQKTLRHGTGHLLSSTMVEQLLDNSECGWGLGFAVAGKGKDLRFFHSGSNAGYRALVIAFANIDDGAVIMTNGDNGSQLYQEILRAIADVYDWPALRQRSIEDAAFDEHERRELTGRYAVSNSGEIVIDADGEILQARSPFWNGAARLHRAGKGKFVTLESEGLFTIERDDRGMVSGLDITGYALPLKAKRLP